MPKQIYRYLAVLIAVTWTLLPVYWLLRLAFMRVTDIFSFPPLVLPPDPSLANFFNILGFDYRFPDGTLQTVSGQARQILFALKNSLIVATLTSLLTLLVVVPLAYTFARLEFRFKTHLLMAILLSVAVPPVSTLIPFYALFTRVGLTGTHAGLILVTLTITIPFVTWMLIGYFRNLPDIEKLAQIDGFGRLYTLVRIIVPMSGSGIAVAGIVAFLFSWNEFVFATILVNGTDATTLPAAVSGFLFQQPEPGHMAAAIWLTMVPAALIVFFLQRHITEMNIVDPIR
jgi:multiple sugar transport system permease protein